MSKIVPLFSADGLPLPRKEGRKPKVSIPSPTESMAEQLHTFAQDDTPSKVNVPNGWPGIVMWMLGRHGPIALFVACTWFLYQDNKANQALMHTIAKENQAQMLEVAKAQIAVNSQVVAQMVEVKSAISAMVEEAKRAHKPAP